MAMPRQPISAPAVAEPLGLATAVGVGVIDATRGDGEDPSGNWTKGYTMVGEVCGVHSLYLLNPQVCDDEGNLIEDLAITDDFTGWEAQVDGNPFVIGAGLQCGIRTSPKDLASWNTRVERRLELCRWSALANELWTGAKGKLDEAPNRYLASPDADIVSGGPFGVVEGVAQMDASLATCNCGGPRVIHASAYAIDWMKAKGVIEARGQRWYTPAGNLVMTDDGYPGTGPDTAGTPPTPHAANAAGFTWIYGTTPIVVKWGPVYTPHDMNEAMDYRTNDVMVTAWQYAMASWFCCHFAVQINTALPAGG